MRSTRIVAVEPQWLAGQVREVRPEDIGGARVLLLDVWPVTHRTTWFDVDQRGDYTVCLPSARFDGGAEWESIESGVVRTESGDLALVDERDAVEALALWREREMIEEQLGELLLLEPGQYEIAVWRHRKRKELVVCVSHSDKPTVEEQTEPEPLIVTDELDLHGFAPKDAAEVIRVYCHVAAVQGIREARVVHGKGIGEIRRLTHKILAEHENVVDFADAPPERGGTGATLVHLVDVGEEKEED